MSSNRTKCPMEFKKSFADTAMTSRFAVPTQWYYMYSLYCHFSSVLTNLPIKSVGSGP